MKKIFTLIAMGIWTIAVDAQSAFIQEVNYLGAFPVTDNTPATDWTAGWANFDPASTVYAAPTVQVTANITSSTTWTSNNVYQLIGNIAVTNGATLTIQPGTLIKGDKTSKSCLIITQGSKINAQGSASAPIVFTSNEDTATRDMGDWGGLIILGNGVINTPGTDPACTGCGTNPNVNKIEGFASYDAVQLYGGSDNMDSSGVLSYVRIEFAGVALSSTPNSEINGLTFGGVGSKTKVNHVQVSFSGDDAFEWFGGAVNCKNIIALRTFDDDLDTDFGYVGNVQFGLVIRDPNLADASKVESFESDNYNPGVGRTPLTAPVFSNITVVGPTRDGSVTPGSNLFLCGAQLRRNTATSIFNTIITGWPTGLQIESSSTQDNFTDDSAAFANNWIIGATKAINTTTSPLSFYQTFFGSDNNDSTKTNTNVGWVNPFPLSLEATPDFRLQAASFASASAASFTNAKIAAQVLTAPTVTATVDYCEGDIASALTANAASGNTLYWYTSAMGGTGSTTAPIPSTTSAGNTTYYVSQISPQGAESARASITVTVHSLPTAPSITASGSTSFCTGDSVILTSSASSGNTWSTNATTNSITVYTTGNYTVMVTDGNTCTSVASAVTSVNVSNAPLPTISINGSTTLCQGEMVTLTSSAADSYSWSNGDTTQSITISTAGSYSVTTTNSNACDGVGTSAGTAVTVNPIPTAVGAVDSIAGYNVTFENTSTGATTYSWDFGDQSNSSAATPTHAYAANGSYTVTLIASNGTCDDTITFSVMMSVGIEEIQTLSGVNLYPNPVSQEATVNINLNTTTKVGVYVYDITGQLILNAYEGEMNTGANTLKLDTSNLPAGVYFTTIVSNNNEKKMLKMIVVK